MLDQMRMWLNDLTRKTYPQTAEKGKRAVARDIGKLFVGIERPEILDWIRKAMRKRDPAGFFNEYHGEQSLAAIHRKMRTRRTGRVDFRGRGKVQLGTWAVPMKWHVLKADLDAYRRAVLSDVGRLAAGWLPAAHHFGATAPSYVERHAGDAEGTFSDTMKDNGSGKLEAVNTVMWASPKLNFIVRATARTRERNLTKHLQKALERECEKENARK